MWVELKKFAFICHDMFPYNDEELAWINKDLTPKTKELKYSLFNSILFAFAAAILSTIIPPLIYFSRFNLF